MLWRRKPDRHTLTEGNDGSLIVHCMHGPDSAYTTTVNASGKLALEWQPRQPGGMVGVFCAQVPAGQVADLSVEGSDEVTEVDGSDEITLVLHEFEDPGSHVATLTLGRYRARAVALVGVRQLAISAEIDPDWPWCVQLALPAETEYPVTVHWDVSCDDGGFETVTAPGPVRFCYRNPGTYTIDVEDAADNHGSCRVAVYG